VAEVRGADVGPDAVWAQIERGAGQRLDYRIVENGDVRCNRTAYGFHLGGQWYPLLDGADPRSLWRAVASRSRPRPVTFVMHQFMDAADVEPAWAMMQRGETADDPRLRETQNASPRATTRWDTRRPGPWSRRACSTACSDPAENATLRRLLPIDEVRRTVTPTRSEQT